MESIMAKHVRLILEQVQLMEDIGGPDSAEYITILETVQSDIQRRLDNARMIEAEELKAVIALDKETHNRG